MDVLVYSALNEQTALKKEIAEKQKCLFELKKNKNNPAVDTTVTALSTAKDWLTTKEKAHFNAPDTTTNWTVWEGEGWTGEVKVCDTSGYYRCGGSCTWTVPAGATKARFQIWGAGGGANKAPCCCGHTPFGSTGAWASVIIPVQAGWSYELCGGCAYCCYAYTTSGSQRWSGCPSYVQGCHLCGFCADGGQGSLGTWNAMRGNYCTCRIAALTNDNQGARICNYGGDWCYTGETFNCIPYIAGAGYHGSICELECPTFENTIYGLRGIWPMQCWDTNHYGWEQHAPIMGFDTETQCCSTFTSGNCCGYNCGAWTGNGCLRYPAAGGWGSHAMGGGNGLCGDSGKFGMVCVQWK